MTARCGDGGDRATPDIRGVYALLRATNRGDSTHAYTLAAGWRPDELVGALVEAHLGALRNHASHELALPLSSSRVTDRVDQLLEEALHTIHTVDHRTPDDQRHE